MGSLNPTEIKSTGGGLVNRLIQRGLKKWGLEIQRTAFKRNLMDFIDDRRIDLVLDVGANVGQFGSELRSKGYRGRIKSFEPIAAVYGLLADNTATDTDWETYNYALGTEAGSAEIHVAESTVFSSMLASTQAATRFATTAAVAGTETIEVRRLDDVCHAMSGNVLLKIDTQGFEQQVLEGGRSVLPMMKGILMELPIIHLYEATWRFHEAVAFMDDAGFVPAQVRPVNFHSTDTVSLVEVDCLFRPRDPRVD
jgi:FkbM family methyltransferase